MRDKEIGPRFVPIIPDEARAFGIDAFFPTAKIYNPRGQAARGGRPRAAAGLQGEPARPGSGQHLRHQRGGRARGVHRGGRLNAYRRRASRSSRSTSSTRCSASSAPATPSGPPATEMVRGFLIGAKAGRTTLAGEGLQRADGHSLTLAATNPAVLAYDPGYGFEMAHIVRRRPRRMYGGNRESEGENVMYYLTVYNEPYVQPAEPDGPRRRRAAARDLPHLERGTTRAAGAPARLRCRRCRGRCGRGRCSPSSGASARRSGR